MPPSPRTAWSGLAQVKQHWAVSFPDPRTHAVVVRVPAVQQELLAGLVPPKDMALGPAKAPRGVRLRELRPRRVHQSKRSAAPKTPPKTL